MVPTPLGLEAPVMTPNGVTFLSFFLLLWCPRPYKKQWTSTCTCCHDGQTKLLESHTSNQQAHFHLHACTWADCPIQNKPNSQFETVLSSRHLETFLRWILPWRLLLCCIAFGALGSEQPGILCHSTTVFNQNSGCGCTCQVKKTLSCRVWTYNQQSCSLKSNFYIDQQKNS